MRLCAASAFTVPLKLLLNPPAAVFCARLSRRPLEQRHAPGTSRCESRTPQVFKSCTLFLVLEHVLPSPAFPRRPCPSSRPLLWRRSPSILASSSFLRHGTATMISRLLRSHFSLAVFLRTVLASQSPSRFPTVTSPVVALMPKYTSTFQAACCSTPLL